MTTHYKFNDLIIFLLTFCYTVAVLFSNSWQECIFWTVLSFIQLIIMAKVQWKYIFFFIVLLIIPAISIFLTSYLHLKSDVSGYPVVIAGIELDSYRCTVSIYLMVRAMSLSLISFAFLTAISYDRLIYSMIRNLRFPVMWGYALLAAFNSTAKLKSEFLRIRQASILRFSKKPLFYFYLLPLLVSATRYSQQAAMSMQARGLNNEKSFIVDMKLKLHDVLLLIINVCGIIIYALLDKGY